MSPMTRVETRPVLGCTMSLVRTPEAKRPAHRVLDETGLLRHVERVAQHHREGQNAGERVGDALAGDVRRAAVHRLVERLAPAARVGRAERGRGQHAERARQHRRAIRQHVAEQIAGDDDVELLRLAHELHRAIIGVHERQLDIGVIGVRRVAPPRATARPIP